MKINLGNNIIVTTYKSGIVTLSDGRGNMGSAHPNIHKTGSVRGMKKRGYWNKDDKMARAGSYTYNISKAAGSHKLDIIAQNMCRCGGNHIHEFRIMSRDEAIKLAEKQLGL